MTPLVPAVVNRTGALEITLSKTQATEGDDRTVTLTVALPDRAAAAADRQIAVAASGTPTAEETQDWTLETTGKTLAKGAQSVAFAITVIDDARLEGDESVNFAITADGAPSGTATLTIADDDRAVLAVAGPEGPVTEGGTSFTLKLRLEPAPENGPPVPDDACFLDFPVAATLSVTGNGAELSDTPSLPADVSFPATSFDDCTREVTIELETRASDGTWQRDRAVSFALERESGADERIDPGTAMVTVRDDSPVPGPIVTNITVSPVPPEASEDYPPAGNKAKFEAVPDAAVHGPGAVLTFTLHFDMDVTVILDPDRLAQPELALDIFGRTRRAQQYTGPVGTPTRTMTFRWKVERGDYDSDGLGVSGIVLNGATIKDAQNRPTSDSTFPVTHFKAHRVRGGFWEMSLDVSGPAPREGEIFEVKVRRDGGFDEHAAAFIQATDSAVINPNTGEPQAMQFAVELHRAKSRADFDGDPAVGSYALNVRGDGEADTERMLTFQLVGSGGTTHTAWYDISQPASANVSVTDAGIAATGPKFLVGPADIHEPETGTAPLRFRVCLWSGSLCPDAGQDTEFEAFNGVDHEVQVDYATEDGTATAWENDYVATRGTLVFAPGETVKTVEVVVLADGHDEGTETMWLELSNPVGAEIERGRNFGQIHNTGPIPKAWITRFGRTVGTQVVEALTQRLEAGEDTQVTLGGLQLTGGEGPEEKASDERTLTLPDWDDRMRLDHATRTMTRKELIAGSSFHLSTGAHEAGASVTAWGTVSVGTFDATEDEVTLDGEVTTGLFGADAKWDRFLAGVMVSQSRGDGAYRLDREGADNGDKGTIEASLTGVYPYLEAKLNERVSAWGLVGSGSGDLTVKRENEVIETDLGMTMGALGVKGRVLDGSGPSGIGLNLKSDAMWVKTESERTEGMMGAEGEVSRLRLIVQGDRAFAMEGGGTFVPSAEIGLRIDGGDAETGTGLELGAGVRYARGPLSIEGQFRGLVAHEESGYEEWGASGAIRVSPSASGRGLTFSIAPVWGNAGSQADRLFGARDARELEPGAEFEATGRLETELGYGIGVPGTRGVVTPYTGLSLIEGGGRTVRAGTRWDLAPGAVMGLERTWQAGADGAQGTNAIEFRTEVRW